MVHYEIRIEGVLDEHWSSWFGDLDVSAERGGLTVLRGQLADQAALHGVLVRIRDLGLVIVELRRVDERG